MVGAALFLQPRSVLLCSVCLCTALLEMPVLDYIQHIRLTQNASARTTKALVIAIPATATFMDAAIKLDMLKVHRSGPGPGHLCWAEHALPALCVYVLGVRGVCAEGVEGGGCTRAAHGCAAPMRCFMHTSHPVSPLPQHPHPTTAPSTHTRGGWGVDAPT